MKHEQLSDNIMQLRKWYAKYAGSLTYVQCQKVERLIADLQEVHNQLLKKFSDELHISDES